MSSLRVVCMWCKELIRIEEHPEDAFPVSVNGERLLVTHGICAACSAESRASYAALKLQRAGGTDVPSQV